MSTTTHKIGTVDALAGDLYGRVRKALRPIADEGTRMGVFMDHAVGRLEDELIPEALAPQRITYRPLDGFYLNLPADLSPEAVDAELDAAEEAVRIELADLLEDGGLAQALAA